MEKIDWDNLAEELNRCHGMLMSIWNRYREQMYRRGFETVDAVQEVSSRVLTNGVNFRGTTRGEFCKWSGVILRNWILEELRRRRPTQMESDHEPPDPGQERPSVAYQDELRWSAYQLARAQLPAEECILIELMYEQEPKLSMREVRDRLSTDHPRQWATHQDEWNTDYLLKKAGEQAREHINELMCAIQQQLEGEPTDEKSPE